MFMLLSGEPDGTLSVAMQPAASQASSLTLARLRLEGGSVAYDWISPGPGSPPVAHGALGTSPDGAPLRVSLIGVDTDGRAHMRLRSPQPVLMSLGAHDEVISEEVTLSLDGLPPGEPVTGMTLACSNVPVVVLHDALIRGTGFDPDPDNNCSLGIGQAHVGRVTDAPGTSGPHLVVSEIGAAGGGVLSVGDLDRDGRADVVLSAGMQLDLGPNHGLPADAVARLAAVVEPCLGTPEECGLGLQLFRPASNGGRGTVAIPSSMVPQKVTLVSRLAGAPVDSVTLPAPLPPQLFVGELHALDGSPMLFDVAVNFEDLFCSCDVQCECVAMSLHAPAPSLIQLAGSPLGPLSVDEIEVRLALEPDPGGVPIEIVALSLTGTHLCDAGLYLTHFDPATGDVDGDGFARGSDCDDEDSSIWSPPGEVDGLGFQRGPDDICWVATPDAGGTLGVLYDTLRASDSSDFSSSTCVETRGTDTETNDPTTPGTSDTLYYLIRASNACPQPGTLGAGGGGGGGAVFLREAPVCP
jgi:hypothetical protein